MPYNGGFIGAGNISALKKLLQTETSCDSSKLKSIRLYNGIPIFSKDVIERIMKEVSTGKAA